MTDVRVLGVCLLRSGVLLFTYFVIHFLLDLLADSLRCLLRHYLLILLFVVPGETDKREEEV